MTKLPLGMEGMPLDTDLYDLSYSVYDYEEMVGTIGEIVVSVEVGTYQGDWLILLRSDEHGWGFVTFGYGSCSGCDALQNCKTIRDWVVLRDRLAGDTKWFDDEDKLARGMIEYDWRVQYMEDRGVLAFFGAVADALPTDAYIRTITRIDKEHTP